VITVDDDGDGDFTSIKEAVSHASAGDVIEVYSGIYNEYNISITTPDVTLKGIPYELGNGTSTGKPFIDGKGLDVVLIILADNVTFSGFHIENQGNRLVNAILLSNNSKNCVVSDNDIRNNSYGMMIDCASCNNCSILDNTLSNCPDYQGIIVGSLSNYITISGNVITGVSIGIDISDSPHNIVTRNKISKCWHGIDIWGENNTILLNNLENNSVGLGSYSYNTVIKHNNFINNKKQATFIIPPSIWHGPGYIKWIGNYWNRTRILPQFIFGWSCALPWFNIDWRPALKPYDIEYLKV